MEKPHIPSAETSAVVNREKKDWRDIIRNPRRRFDQAFRDQFVKITDIEHVLDDGRKIPDIREEYAPGALELADQLIKFWQDADKQHEKYWEKDISKSGARFHRSSQFHLDQIGEFKGALKHYDVGGMVADGIEGDTQLAFDIFTCIQDTKPDQILALSNGAADLSAVALTMGFDADNYLAVHHDTDTEYRTDLPAEPVYEGKPIVPGTRVLILEDISSLGEKRTYRTARKWLADQGVTDTPVFIERTIQLCDTAMSTEGFTDEQFIAYQEDLTADNCYNSFCRWDLRRKDVAFWEKMKNKLIDATEKDPVLYTQFFDLIRNHAK